MCQYSTYVTLAVCADVQRTGDPSACKRQTIVSAARATAPANPLDSSALDRHLAIICGAIDERRAEKEPVVTAAAAAAPLAATHGFDGSSKGPGRKGPRALARVRDLAKGAVGRINSLTFPLTASTFPLRSHPAHSPLRLLSQTNDSTTLLHRHFERARIEKLGPAPSTWGPKAERREEVEERIRTWRETGTFWVKETDSVPRKRRVRFADEVEEREGEEEWSSMLGHRFGIPGLGRVDSGVEVKA